MITMGETDELCDTRIGHSGCGHGGILSGCLCLVMCIDALTVKPKRVG